MAPQRRKECQALDVLRLEFLSAFKGSRGPIELFRSGDDFLAKLGELTPTLRDREIVKISQRYYVLTFSVLEEARLMQDGPPPDLAAYQVEKYVSLWKGKLKALSNAFDGTSIDFAARCDEVGVTIKLRE